MVDSIDYEIEDGKKRATSSTVFKKSQELVSDGKKHLSPVKKDIDKTEELSEYGNPS
jgi:hypothetical protein